MYTHSPTLVTRLHLRSLSHTATMSETQTEHDAIRLSVPRELYLLPTSMVLAGSVLGMFRGGRREALRFLAENAHRAPTTLQGWYFYNKTKNYRVMLGAIKGAGADGLRLGLTAVGWVAAEQTMERVGLDDVREVGAGVGTAAVFAAACKCVLDVVAEDAPDTLLSRSAAVARCPPGAVPRAADGRDDARAPARRRACQRTTASRRVNESDSMETCLHLYYKYIEYI